MKQDSGIDQAWQKDSDTPRRRWLRWLLGSGSVVALAWALGFARDPVDLAALLAVCIVPVFLWQRWRTRLAERRWRRDAILFEPPLPKPVSRIDDEREWRWPAHPLVRISLAIGSTGLLYWALVLHQLQLPALWLVGTAVVVLFSLWCWREPVVLVLMMAAGVALLALLRWLSDLLTVAGAIGVLLAVLAAGGVALAEIRKRTDKHRTTS